MTPIKVKNIFYHEPTEYERGKRPFATGLIFELENGIKLRENSTDVVQTLETINPECKCKGRYASSSIDCDCNEFCECHNFKLS